MSLGSGETENTGGIDLYWRRNSQKEIEKKALLRIPHSSVQIEVTDYFKQ